MLLEVTAFLVVGLIIFKLIRKEEDEDCMLYEGKKKVVYFKLKNDFFNGSPSGRERFGITSRPKACI